MWTSSSSSSSSPLDILWFCFYIALTLVLSPFLILFLIFRFWLELSCISLHLHLLGNFILYIYFFVHLWFSLQQPPKAEKNSWKHKFVLCSLCTSALSCTVCLALLAALCRRLHCFVFQLLFNIFYFWPFGCHTSINCLQLHFAAFAGNRIHFINKNKNLFILFLFFFLSPLNVSCS